MKIEINYSIIHTLSFFVESIEFATMNDGRIQENKSSMDTTEPDSEKMNIVGLDEDEPEIAYLIGYDEDEKDTKEHKVNFEALKKYSRFVRSAVEGDKECRKFEVKTGRPGEDKLVSCYTVEVIANWINHYSGKGSIKPPIIEYPMKQRDLQAVIKYTFQKSSLSKEVKESEGLWWEQFIASMESRRNVIYNVFFAANRMDMTDTKEYGGLVNMLAARLANHIKGEPLDAITSNFESLGDPQKVS